MNCTFQRHWKVPFLEIPCATLPKDSLEAAFLNQQTYFDAIVGMLRYKRFTMGPTIIACFQWIISAKVISKTNTIITEKQPQFTLVIALGFGLLDKQGIIPQKR